MALVSFISQIKSASSIPDLARRLGELCLDAGGDLKGILRDPVAAEEMTRLEKQVAAIDPDHWKAALADPAKVAKHLGQDVLDLIDLIEAHHPLENLAVLRGLCRRTLPVFYLEVEEKVALDRGTPIPFATRPIHDLFHPDRATPFQGTLSRGHLLESLNYSIFSHRASEDIRVVLDFSHRDRLDELTWASKKRLPRIATIHPSDSEVIVGEIGTTEFFEVKPAKWSDKAILDLLRSASDAEIAVLPELCLPKPDALSETLASEPDAFPPIVIAGSSHVRRTQDDGREIRSNESCIYIDGKHVASACKCHPFSMQRLGEVTFEKPLREGITGEQKTITILSGRNTRLAVVVCADLNDERIPSMLTSAGVNLLMVPTYTAEIGAFNGSISQVASGCQGVAVVANARIAPNGRPFLCMVAVPRPQPDEQSSFRVGPQRQPPVELAVVNPNERLAGAVEWR